MRRDFVPGRVARELRPFRRFMLAALALLLTSASPSCRPLYLPPLPEMLPVLEEQTRLSGVRLREVFGTLQLSFVPVALPADGWLAVQWFPPAGPEVASQSVWLDAATLGRTVRLSWPSDVSRETPGRWRAVLSFAGRVVRQVEWIEPAGQ